MKILTAAEMNRVDQLSTEQFGLPSLILMENAGFNLYMAILDYFEDPSELDIAIICGKGNNGGDGLVLARHLLQRSIIPDIYLLASSQDVSGDAGTNLNILLKGGYSVQEIETEEDWEKVADRILLYDLIVDALLGTGITKELSGRYASAVRSINGSGAFILSVDIPSGMFSDSLEKGPLNVQADATVTFTAPKPAHILHPNQEELGDLYIVPIGSPPALMEKEEYRHNLITWENAARSLLSRDAASHKGTYGHAVLLAGSQGKGGAAGLTSYSALKAGSGLVSACIPDRVQSLVASYHPEIMTQGFSSTEQGTFSREALPEVLKFLQEKDSAGVGPGLTTEEETVEFVQQLVADSPVPLILDADALNAFQGQPEALENHRKQPLILTPHPGEFSRLSGEKTTRVTSEPLLLTREFAMRHSLWIVLKMFRTVIAEPGGQVYVSPLGNPGMASAGMGDVLTGIITSIVGQYAARGRIRPKDITRAVSLAVFLHGIAGDLAADEIGQDALTAGDVLLKLGEAYRLLSGEG